MHPHSTRNRRLPHGAAWAGAALAALLLVGCSSKPAPTAQAADTPHNVTLTQAQQGSIHLITVKPASYHASVTTTGVVDFDRNHATDVLAPFSGAVTKVLVTIGQSVKAGQALATVHSPDFANAAGAYRQALLAARAAGAVAKNDRALYQHQAISQRDNAAAQTAAAGADTQRDAALQALVALHVPAKTIAGIRAGKSVAAKPAVIRAPIAGTVVEKSMAPGQTLAAGSSPCFTIADTSTMWVRAHLFGDAVARVHAGDPASVVTGDGGEPVTGKVTYVGAVVDAATRSVNARVAVPNTDGALKKHMYVTVHIHSRATHTGLLVPDSAVLRDEENLPFVYVAASGGGYARQAVKLGSRVGDRYVIAGGLHSGAKVVADGGIFLRFIESQ